MGAVKPGDARPAAGADVSWVELDLHTSPENSYELLGRPDVCMHLAWQGLPDYKSLHHFETELPAQYAFLSDLVSQGLRSVLVTGTCFEYGLRSGELNEEDETSPETAYGFAKDALRRELTFLMAKRPFDLTWARMFYMWGDGQAPNSLWPQLKAAVERGDPVFNISGGAQLRDYLHVTKVAYYLVELALRPPGHGVVNVCSGTPHSVRSLVEGWIRDNEWAINLNPGFYPYTDYEPMEFWGNPAKLKSIVDA